MAKTGFISMGFLAVSITMLCVAMMHPATARGGEGDRPPVIWLQTAQLDLGQAARGPETGLPLPRFASLRPDQVNARTGPGLSYPIDWIYQRAGLPVEITAEYDTWRRIRDRDQTETWVHQSMLSGSRGALVTDSEITLRQAPDVEAKPVARVEAGVVGVIQSCDGQWCEIDVGDYAGWASISSFFGAYPGEMVR
ncbi:MAG: SH3 domain-containing protein [Pseudomonadota bacterium]